MRAKRSVILLGLGVVAMGSLGLAATSGVVRDAVKASPAFRVVSSPAVRRLDAAIFNARFQPMPAEGMGDGRHMSELALEDPSGLALDSQGNLYIADRGTYRYGRFIWKVEPGGLTHVVAGNGRRGEARTDVAAVKTALGSPQGLAIDRQDRVYFADSYNHVVLRLEPTGRLTRVAGTGSPGFSGDGGPAAAAALNQPYDVRIDADGNLYIADFGNNRIRKVTPAGIILTVAGSGEPGYSGDGGPATAARLWGPYGVYPDAGGGVLITDSHNNVVRRVDADGVIRTIAGSGARGYTGDGGLATEARLDSPQSLFIIGESLYINDEHNHVIRVVDAGGVIRSFMGVGFAGIGGDGASPELAQLNDPECFVMRSDGSLLIAENHRIRIVNPASTVGTLAGRQRDLTRH